MSLCFSFSVFSHEVKLLDMTRPILTHITYLCGPVAGSKCRRWLFSQSGVAAWTYWLSSWEMESTSNSSPSIHKHKTYTQEQPSICLNVFTWLTDLSVIRNSTVYLTWDNVSANDNYSLDNIGLFKRHTYQKWVWPCWGVGWYDTVIISCFISNVHFNCIVQNSLYPYMDNGIMLHCALVGCTQSQSIEVVFGCGLFWCWVSLGTPYIHTLIKSATRTQI